jgi:hypothetical protein
MRLLLAFAAVLAIGAGVVVVVVSGGSSGGVEAPRISAAVPPSGTAPNPPHGALVLARGDGDLAVALAVRRAGPALRLTGTVLASDGTGLAGLRVRFAVGATQLPPAKPCGPGCYASSAKNGATARRVSIALSGRGRAPSTVAFELPEHWPVSATPLLRGAERVFKSLRGVVYHERLSSGPRVTITTVWRSEAPNRVSYSTSGGDKGIVIGTTRWDLVVGGGWKRSSQDPPLVMPSPPWGAGAYDVTLLGGGRLDGHTVVRFSMFEPITPAWYTVTLDRRTLRTLNVAMTAAAHFMVDHYVTFNAPRQIRPPVGR